VAGWLDSWTDAATTKSEFPVNLLNRRALASSHTTTSSHNKFQRFTFLVPLLLMRLEEFFTSWRVDLLLFPMILIPAGLAGCTAQDKSILLWLDLLTSIMAFLCCKWRAWPGMFGPRIDAETRAATGDADGSLAVAAAEAIQLRHRMTVLSRELEETQEWLQIERARSARVEERCLALEQSVHAFKYQPQALP